MAATCGRSVEDGIEMGLHLRHEMRLRPLLPVVKSQLPLVFGG